MDRAPDAPAPESKMGGKLIFHFLMPRKLWDSMLWFLGQIYLLTIKTEKRPALINCARRSELTRQPSERSRVIGLGNAVTLG